MDLDQLKKITDCEVTGNRTSRRITNARQAGTYHLGSDGKRLPKTYAVARLLVPGFVMPDQMPHLHRQEEKRTGPQQILARLFLDALADIAALTRGEFLPRCYGQYASRKALMETLAWIEGEEKKDAPAPYSFAQAAEAVGLKEEYAREKIRKFLKRWHEQQKTERRIAA